MKRILVFTLFLLCSLPLMARNLEGVFKTIDGQTFEGRTVTYKPEGATFRLTAGPNKGGFEGPIPWRRFTAETLNFFNTDLDARPFVSLLIATPEEEMAEEMAASENAASSAAVGSVDIVSHGRPEKVPGLIGSFFKGGGLLLLLFLYAANVYAAFEISFFRRYPMPMVTGISAAAPFITPIVFLCMPLKKKKKVVIEEPEEEDYEEEYAEGEYAEGEYGAEAAVVYDEHGNPVAADPAAGGYAVPYQEPEPEPVQLPESKVFERGKFNLNRRFIESKFAGFFRAVPGENEKDMIIVVRASQGEFISNRILKATNTEVTFSVPKGDEDSGATIDKVIPLNDLLCLTLKHKDAPD